MPIDDAGDLARPPSCRQPETSIARHDTETLTTKLFYGAGSIAFGIKDQGFGTLLLFFYNQVVGLSSASVGLAISLALAFDAFADPAVGLWSDNLRSRWGRRHPFMYAAAIPVAVGYWFLWNPPHASASFTFVYLVIASIVVRTFITCYEIPSSALVAELTKNYDQRTSFLAYRYFFGWMGGLAMSILAFSVFFRSTPAYPQGQLNPAGYSPFALTAAVVMAITIVISSSGTHRFIPQFLVPPKRKLTLGTLLKEAKETGWNRSFLVLVASNLLSVTATGVVATLGLYFSTYFWGFNGPQIALITVSTVVAPIVALVASAPLAARLGKKQTAVVMWLTSTAFGWVPLAARLLGVFPANGSPLVLPLVLAFYLISTTLSIICSITISSMMADVVEDSQRKTGRRSEGFFFAANAFALKAVSGMGILMAGLLLTLVHFPQHANPATLNPAIPRNLALVYMPTVFTLYGVALVFIYFYRIDRESHEANLRVLAAEANEAATSVPE
jgi:glycoside/pentoside/hexuronide:cation symporter, GPH family